MQSIQKCDCKRRIIMVNGLFRDISEEEIMSVNGGCGGSGSPYAAMMPCQKCIDKGNAYMSSVVRTTVAAAVVGAQRGGPVGALAGAVSGFITGIITTKVPEPHSEHAH